MAVFDVPEGGLVLQDGCTSKHSDSTKTLVQVMQLDLANGTIDELFKCARKGNPIHVAFGKTISLQYGTKQRHLDAIPATSDTHIYSSSSDDPTKLQFAGQVSHTLAMQKAEEVMASTDDALAQLQSSLASAKQAKASNQIQFIPDGSKLPPAKKQTMQSLKSSKSSSSLSFLKNKTGIHKHPVTQSTPTSPSIGAIGLPSTQERTSTSNSTGTVPKEKVQKQVDAIRIPLIHILATRPLSAKYLAGKLNCSRDFIDQALEKVSRPSRGDPEKRELNDKTYKELDVWSFNYPDTYERDNAIQRSVAAFDRMRMSQEDPRWQLLYIKEERNKGRTLSRLDHLAKGAIQQSATPRIHVQQPEDSVDEKPTKDSSGESDQKGRLTPKSSEPMARSKSGDQIKKKKVSEKEAQAKRLLSNGPKKVKPEVKEKEAHPAVKKAVNKKGPVPKSEEFVHDSDEEDGLAESMAIDAQNSPPTKATKTTSSPQATPNSPAIKGVSSKISKKTVPNKATTPKPIKHDSNVKVSKPAKPVKPVQVVQASFPNLKTATPSDVKAKEEEAKRRAEGKPHHKKIPSSPAATPGAKARLSEAASQQGATAMQKTLSRNRNGSSPHKPSPLGSSPPTNASEFGTQSHNNITPPSSASSNGNAKKDTSNAAANGHVRKVSVESNLKVNGHGQQQQQLGHCRKPSNTTSSDAATLKRKANDLDTGIHNHTDSPLNNTARSSSPFTNGAGGGRVMHDPHPTSKKQKKTSSEEEAAETDSSTSPLSSHELKLREAQRFKSLHAKYEKAYREVMGTEDASEEQVRVVKRMHGKLEEIKRSIMRGRF